MTDDRASDLPALSIRRPWLVIVINLLIVIAGVGAWLGVEVRELPNIDRPIVAVRADYPGAAPETLDAEVTRIVADELKGRLPVISSIVCEGLADAAEHALPPGAAEEARDAMFKYIDRVGKVARRQVERREASEAAAIAIL